MHLTPWDLRRLDVALGSGRVLVVEIPSVLEVVRRAARRTLRCGLHGRLAGGGGTRPARPTRRAARLSRDFDWRGVEICNWLIERRGVHLWRMSEADYLAAPGGGPLTGREVPTPWDPALAAAMRERGVAKREEQVVDVLLAEWSDGE